MSAVSRVEAVEVQPNVFAPFSVPASKVADLNTVHWGNVDTGAMVNVVYMGVVRVFKELQRYIMKFEHELTGVGGKKTKIIAKLCDVPIVLGDKDVGHSAHTTTFYVLDNQDYHWILGLPLLS